MFRVIILLLLVISSSIAEPDWSDEFNNDTLDTTKWIVAFPGERRDAINDLKQVTVKDGCLRIEAKTIGNKHYTAMVSTEGLFESKYGYWEIRAKADDRSGTWSDAWLYNRTGDESEIDIFEHRANNIVNYGMHWNGYGVNHQCTGGDYKLKNNDFHIYGFIRTKDTFYFIVDGVIVNRLLSITNKPMFLILSTEIQDNYWAGNIPKEGYNNTTLIVDYVRFYK